MKKQKFHTSGKFPGIRGKCDCNNETREGIDAAKALMKAQGDDAPDMTPRGVVDELAPKVDYDISKPPGAADVIKREKK